MFFAKCALISRAPGEDHGTERNKMIYLYSGTPGSGKSFHVAKDICSYLFWGKNIIANFDVNARMIQKYKGKFYYFDNSEITPQKLLTFSEEQHKHKANGHIIEGQTILILDECQIMFNCRDWQNSNRNEWITFFTQHRKYGFDIILVTQNDRLIDRAIRSLIEYEYKHRKFNNMGFVGYMTGLLLGNRPIFGVIEMWYGLKERVGVTIMIGRKRYYNLYDSYKLFAPPSDHAGKA